MKETVDGRGSIPQREIFNQIKDLYKEYKVIYELYIPEINQRFDIFVMELGIAIEYDGDQHVKFNEFFHENTNGYIQSKRLDIKKEKFCKDNGIKLVRLNADFDFKNKNKIIDAINGVEYPEGDFCVDIFDYRSERLEKEKEYRKQRYLSNKVKH